MIDALFRCRRLLTEKRALGHLADPDFGPYVTRTRCVLDAGHVGKHDWTAPLSDEAPERPAPAMREEEGR